MQGALFHKLFAACWSKGKFCAIQVDVNNGPFPDLKLDTFAVPLEAKIELLLEREAHSQFSVRRLEIAQIYPSGPLESMKTWFLQVFRSHPDVSRERPWSRPESLGPLYYNGFKRISISWDWKIPACESAIQVDVKNTPFPDLKLDTFPVPLEARIEPWLEREAHSQFSVRRLEIAQIYPSGDPQRPLKVLRPLFVKGLERS